MTKHRNTEAAGAPGTLLVEHSAPSSQVASVAPAASDSMELVEPTPGRLLEIAIRSGLGVEGMKALAEIYERDQAKRAEMEFNDAMLAFQSEVPTIRKPRNVEGKYNYAPKEYIESVIRPYCKKHGFSHSFGQCSVKDGSVTVQMTIRHRGGHKVTNEFSCPCNVGTKLMNELHKVGSGTSFAERYCLKMGYGLSLGNEDDDGRSAGSKSITDEQAATLDALLDETKADRERFLKFFNATQLGDLSTSEYPKAVRLLEKKRGES